MGMEEEEEAGVEAGGMDGVEDVDMDVDVDVDVDMDVDVDVDVNVNVVDQPHIRVHQWYVKIFNSVSYIIYVIQKCT